MSTIYEQRETGYNGWANYETWRINLEMFDGYDPSDDLSRYDFADGDREKAIENLSASLESLAEDYINETCTGGLAYDLAMSFLSKVEFEEIAEHMVDDYIADLPTEE